MKSNKIIFVFITSYMIDTDEIKQLNKQIIITLINQTRACSWRAIHKLYLYHRNITNI